MSLEILPVRAARQRRRRRRIASLRRLFLVDHLDLQQATGVADARWEFFQIDHLDDESAFRIENKSRQIAWSWVSAAEATVDALAHLYGDTPRDSVFVSINQTEAAEKIRYARHIYEVLAQHPDLAPRLPALERDSVFSLEFSNGARLDSLPARPPRGRARANVYVDEFAHIRDDEAIYTAALPIISKGGRLRIGSSPFGAAGRFWEIVTQAIRPYPGYTRHQTPWWETYSFSADPHAARRHAPALDTAARVARFGNQRIAVIFANMPLDDFRQEYECAFVDEARSFFSWEELRAVTAPDLYAEISSTRGAAIDAALTAIRQLAQAIRQGRAEPVMAAGFDVGRTRNTSELVVAGLSTAGDYPIRANISLDNTPYDAQADVLRYALAELPILRLWIDRNGIGSQLAEELERHAPGIASGAQFTVQAKQLWATTAKRLIQQGRVKLPADLDLAYQIHSIKRLISAGKQSIFDTETNEKHHADKAWALFLALAAADAGSNQPSADELAGLFEYR